MLVIHADEVYIEYLRRSICGVDLPAWPDDYSMEKFARPGHAALHRVAAPERTKGEQTNSLSSDVLPLALASPQPFLGPSVGCVPSWPVPLVSSCPYNGA